MKEKKEKIQKINFDTATLLLRKADKYYVSFRVLNKYGFYFQGLTCLLFSLEIFLKLIYILEKGNYTNIELKNLGHDTKKIAKRVKLDEKNFVYIHKIVNNYKYTEIRYDNPDLVNELNSQDKKGNFVILNKLNQEVIQIHKLITKQIRIKFNASNYIDGLNINRNYNNFLTPKPIKEFIDGCLSDGNKNLRLDRC